MHLLHWQLYDEVLRLHRKQSTGCSCGYEHNYEDHLASELTSWLESNYKLLPIQYYLR